MKLVTEEASKVKIITEEKVPGKKSYFIEGIFLQSEIPNKNGRCYPFEILKNEVDRYVNTNVKENRAYGELGHPDNPQINLERVSHIITELKADGKNFIGRAKILDTPYGKIAKNLIDEGCKLGVSSRGVGTLTEKDGINYVNNDFQLCTPADLVSDPSAPQAFVNGLMEGKEWIWENGILKEKKLEEFKKTIRDAAKKKLAEAQIRVFNEFLRNL